MTFERSKKLIFQIAFLDLNLGQRSHKYPKKVSKSQILKVKGQGHPTRSQTVFSMFLKVGHYISIFLTEIQKIDSSKGLIHISN